MIVWACWTQGLDETVWWWRLLEQDRRSSEEDLVGLC